jgi:hypothetical protein
MSLKLVEQLDHGEPEHVLGLEIHEDFRQVPSVLALVELPDEIRSHVGAPDRSRRAPADIAFSFPSSSLPSMSVRREAPCPVPSVPSWRLTT